MRSIDFPIYQRQEDIDQDEEKNLLDKLQQKFPLVALILSLLGLVLGKVTILNGLMPFGLSYFAVFLYKRDKFFVNPLRLVAILVGVSLGYFIELDMLALKYIIASLLLFSFQKKLIQLDELVYSLSTSLSFLLCQIPYFYFNSAPASYISLGAEVFLILLTTLLLLKSLPDILIYLDKKSNKVKLLLAITSIIGLGIFSLVGERVGGLNLLRVLMTYLIMLFALAIGPTAATILGVITGFIYNITHLDSVALAGNYALAGLIAGNFQKQDKLGVGLGFVLSNLLYATFITIPDYVAPLIQESVIAAIILIATPRRMISAANKLSQEQERGEKLEDKKLQSFITRRVRQFSEIFNELSTAFSEVLPEKENDVNDVGTFLDLITDKVCVKCELCDSCWQQSFYSTYQGIFELLTIAENRGEVLIDDLDEVMPIKCYHKVKLATAINQFVKMYELNHYWENKLYKNEKILLNQLSGMSQVVDNLAEELTISVKPEDEIEKRVHSILKKNGFKVKKVLATNYNNEELELTIRKKSCNGNHECAKNMIPLLNSKMECKFDLTWSECGAQLNKSNCICRLTPAVEYQLQTGVATASQATGISGDNFTFFKQKEGKFMSILSDGMGVGAEACQESKSAVRLLEKMLQAGLDYKLALKSVNSILGLRSKEDNFTTIDLLQIDQMDGKAEFIKFGSASSFIKRGAEISMVKSTTLPIGIVNQVDLESNTLKLQDKDLIIMMSDGVLDSKKNLAIKEEWVLQILRNNLIDAPQTLAQYILDKAKENQKIEDDMTVLVIRVDRC
ncbi:stage II sporulation protein E [Halanaerocella petrolearia]